jgi:hypothetical protein
VPLPARRFPPPWSVDDPDTKLGQDCNIVRDAGLLRLAIGLRRIIAQADPSLIEGDVDAPYDHRGTQENGEQGVVDQRHQVHPPEPDTEAKKVP